MTEFISEIDWFVDSELTQDEVCSFPDNPEPDKEEGARYGAGTVGVERDVWEVLYTVRDPELPLSIVDLGLVYEVSISDGMAEVQWTTTYSGCPAQTHISKEIAHTVKDASSSIETVTVDQVHSPTWTTDMVSERGREIFEAFGMGIHIPAKDHDN